MIVQPLIRSSLTRALISLMMTAHLVACGGGGGGSSTSQVVPSSATITWIAPATRADGSPLSLADIGGYRVYYGTSEGNYPNSVDVDDGTAVQVTLSNLPVGRYYFVVTAYNVAGVESESSPVVTKEI